MKARRDCLTSVCLLVTLNGRFLFIGINVHILHWRCFSLSLLLSFFVNSEQFSFPLFDTKILVYVNFMSILLFSFENSYNISNIHLNDELLLKEIRIESKSFDRIIATEEMMRFSSDQSTRHSSQTYRERSQLTFHGRQSREYLTD